MSDLPLNDVGPSANTKQPLEKKEEYTFLVWTPHAVSE